MADQPPRPERPEGDRDLPPDPLWPPAPERMSIPQPAPGPAGYPMAYPMSTTRRSSQERRAILAQQLQQAAMRQLRVESTTEFQAVLVQGRPVNHVLHAILTIFTCLAWGIVWIVLAITGGETRWQLIVDEFGNVQWQDLGKA